MSRDDEATDGRQPEDLGSDQIPEFGDKAIRRAVRRGITTTVGNTLVALLLLSFLGSTVSAGLQRGFGRGDRMERVVGLGLAVAHPEFIASFGCCNTSLMTMTLGPTSFDEISPQFQPDTVVIEPSQNLLGHLDPATISLPQTALATLIQAPAISASHERAVLAGLPSTTLASAMVLFRQPLEGAPLQDELNRLGVSGIASLLYDVPTQFRSVPDPYGLGRIFRVGWSSVNRGTGLSGWAHQLTPADDQTLHLLGLPGASALQQVASGGVTGIVIQSATVPHLSKMLDDPAVLTVEPADVVFNLGLP